MIVEHYTEIVALRLVNPLNVLGRFARLRQGADDTLGAFLQRDYGPLLGDCDVEAVATSIEEDAAELSAILQEYRAPLALEYDEDDNVHCEICEAGSPCRERFEGDAQDVAMEANARLLPVMMWMHAGALSSLEDSITGMAEDYNQTLAEAVEQAEAAAAELEEQQAERQRRILDKYRPIFFGE